MFNGVGHHRGVDVASTKVLSATAVQRDWYATRPRVRHIINALYENGTTKDQRVPYRSTF